MTLQEFSIEFDIRYNNSMSNMAPGLSEYEKSTYLTNAQDMIVLNYYNGTTGKAFEENELMRSFLHTLITQKTETFEQPELNPTVSLNIDDVLFIIYEEASLANDCNSQFEVEVTPVTYEDLHRIRKNPFKGPSKTRVLRIDEGGSNRDLKLISKYPIQSYICKYLKNPPPIILEDLSEGLSIKRQRNAQESILPPFVHSEILDTAVALAKAAWGETKK
jgi:hypothetical protein